VPVHKTIKKDDDFERTFLRFYYLYGNTAGEYIDAKMGLQIPIERVKDPVAATKRAQDAGFGAEEITFRGKEYLDILT